MEVCLNRENQLGYLLRTGDPLSNRVNQILNKESNARRMAPKMAPNQWDHIKEKIMYIWEIRVREKVASAPSKTTPVLRSQLPELLENLFCSISPKTSPFDVDETREIGKQHGEQRATLLDYSFPQMLLEYRILRQVIFEVLEEEEIRISAVRNVILDVLDEGIEKAIDQFSYIRSEELNRSNRDLLHFAAIAAHDLKSPLATIAGFTELLDSGLRGKIGIDETEYIQAIKRSSARMTLLIDRLLQYSSVGHEVKPFESVLSSRIVEDVIENLKTFIEKSNAEVRVADLPVVWGDISLLSQLFQNFINNAIKFCDSSRRPEIYIDVQEDGPCWIFSIRDNGIGFDPENKENIFSLFKQLSGNGVQGGSGIGLATARKVVELHGGKVWAESQPGVGSTFFFTLPKSQEPVDV